MGDIKVDIDLKAIDAKAARGSALEFPETTVSLVLEGIVGAIARAINWVWVVLVLLIVVNVTLRYAIGANFIAMEEAQWHLYALGFMVGIAYAVKRDSHVRVDVAADAFPLRLRAWIELLGMGLFVLPLCVVLLNHAWPFVLRSWTINEVSAAPGGLPYRWAIKAVILLAFTLLAMAAVARMSRVSAFLFGFPHPRRA